MQPLECDPSPLPPTLSMSEIVDRAIRAMAPLNMPVSSITSAVPDDSGWSVCVELVERRGIPSTNDMLGVYELRLDRGGNVVRYSRTRLRRRCDFGG